MNNRYTNLFRFFFAVVDLFILNFIYLCLVFSVNYFKGTGEGEYILLFIVSNMVWLICAYVTALYINDQSLNFERFFRRTLKAYFMFIPLVFIFIFLYHHKYSRLFVVMSYTGFGIGLVLSRCMLIGALRFLRKRQIFNKKVVLLGYNDLSKKLVNYFTDHHKGMSVEGYFENYDQVHELSNLPILGNIKECIPYAINSRVSEIYSTLSPEKHDFVYEFAQHAEKHFIRFRFVPDFKIFINRNIHVDYVADIPILSLRAEPLEDLAGRIKKRIFDVTFSLFVIVFILSWLAPILAILIKLDSTGPVFFAQMRSGKNNKPFRCYKFRSLKKNKEADSKQVTRNDSRFTRLGKFLRRSNLDELPQFVNVLLGQMSVVGPRPHMLQHTEEFSRLLNKYLIRHFVKPGITGWAQVNGYRGEIKENGQLRKRIEHDIWYMENWSLWLDLRIIYLTLYATAKGNRNAY